MRKVALLTTAAVAVGGTGIAFAAGAKTQELTVKTTPTAAGTAKKPKKTTLDISVGTRAVDDAETGTFASTKTVIFFDKNLKFNNSKFPTCTETAVAAHTCKSTSKVGAGSAAATLKAPNGANIQPTFKVTAWNGPNNTLILELKGEGGFSDQEKVIVGKLKNATGKYGKKLDVDIPLNVQQPVAGLKATITKFRTKINATYKGKPYVVSTGCTKKKYNFKGDFFFDDGTSIKGVTATTKCS